MYLTPHSLSGQTFTNRNLTCIELPTIDIHQDMVLSLAFLMGLRGCCRNLDGVSVEGLQVQNGTQENQNMFQQV